MPFVTVTKESITINGGLVFHREGMVLDIPADVSRQLVITNNHFIGTCPRWYQLRRWWSIIQLVRSHTK